MTALSMLPSCADDNPIDYNLNIDINNFPIIDGSDSTDPLRTILMCKLLGFDYNWERRPFTQEPGADIKMVVPEYTCSESQEEHLRTYCLKQSNTHGSYVNLIDGSVELVIAARSKSRDEAVYADNKGVALIEKPIAKDALAFIVNPDNPVNNLTIEQLQGIYTGGITNWSEVGGKDESIQPYVRNRNSGSQEKFETLVMSGLNIKDFPELQVGLTMMSPYYQIEDDTQGIGYSPFYYYSVIVDNGSTKAIAINGVEMTKENVRNNHYPFTTEVFAAIRSDIDRKSAAYRLFEFLTTPEGQDIVNESGYVRLGNNSSISNLDSSEDKPIFTYFTTLTGIRSIIPQKGFIVKTDVYQNGEKSSRKILIK